MERIQLSLECGLFLVAFVVRATECGGQRDRYRTAAYNAAGAATPERCESLGHGIVTSGQPTSHCSDCDEARGTHSQADQTVPYTTCWVRPEI